ncbi:hypothetical protein PAMC26510_10075 [Caballeronia sordidicola]|uniref:Uncharacterized protein n=1 Tax=Caballeronia sordidicola TaxID=196367 RepID=A0A242MZ90_CABSO|nr:hypothetical protein PAMC26510_10075 [Caballeronia sordidicola]
MRCKRYAHRSSLSDQQPDAVFLSLGAAEYYLLQCDCPNPTMDLP